MSTKTNSKSELASAIVSTARSQGKTKEELEAKYPGYEVKDIQTAAEKETRAEKQVSEKQAREVLRRIRENMSK